ncbi:MAG: acetyl-CoA carboxylase biotin carboxyl carrier protein subunit [Clostridiales Family XIII bacterium]|jgi:biotin carboxyl carrier protein|nr:acetyl-CoA carboxylase biotin carboxyl carrier protein subunit [Clostridiales Family XIII bacterium]
MDVKARVPGEIKLLKVKEGDEVKKLDVLCVMEAMKMEQPIPSPKDGTVKEIKVAVGDKVKVGAVLVVVD